MDDSDNPYGAAKAYHLKFLCSPVPCRTDSVAGGNHKGGHRKGKKAPAGKTRRPRPDDSDDDTAMDMDIECVPGMHARRRPV
jgi:hypothetical protein